MDETQKQALFGIAGLTPGGAAFGAGLAGLGLVQGMLGAQRQRGQFDEFKQEMTRISSPQYLQKLTGQMRASRAGEFAEVARAEQLGAQAGAASTRARFSRAGLTGVGEQMGQTAEIDAFMQGRRTTARLSAEAARMAIEQRNAEMQALQSIISTPYGAVEPISAALAGAGSGIEAATNAMYATRLAGRDN